MDLSSSEHTLAARSACISHSQQKTDQ